jgi:hypothetical protein
MTRHKEAFLVNLWFEPRERGELRPPAWRGSVVHLVTQQRQYFTELLDLVTFLATYAGTAVHDGDSRRE